MPKVSVIVPVYNVEEYLEKSLDSLVNQTLEDIEIIVLNDGTKDNSQNIIDRYRKKYPKKMISIIKENEGVSITRNRGTDMAKGEYIFYADSDDWMDITLLEKMYNHAQIHASDIVVCDYYEVNESVLTSCQSINENISEDISKCFLLSNACPWGKLFKLSYLRKTKLTFLENHVYEDLATIPGHAVFTSAISHVKDPLYYYLIREGSIMRQPIYSKRLEDIFDSIDRLYNIFKDNKKLEDYKEEMEYLYIEHLLHAATLRFIKFDNYRENVNRIIDVMNTKFPNWKKNKYYAKHGIKYKIVCSLIMRNQIKLVKMLIKR